MPGLDFLTVLLIAVGLSADCFAVSLSISTGIKRLAWTSALRAAFFFGAFQALMPVAGWLMGQALAGYISMATPWVAFLLLLIIGGRMLWQSFKKEAAPSGATDYTRGFALFVLAVATSIDALAAGFSFGLLESSVLQACITIGIVAFLASLAGLFLGHFSGTLLGKRAEAVGGLLLIAIGARILIVSLL